MLKCVNGEYLPMTEEEIADFEAQSLQALKTPYIPTDKERLTAIENAIADLAILLSQNLDN